MDKKNTSELIFGLRWFSHLVPNKTNVSLVDHYGRKSLASRFNVCYSVPSGESTYRLFASCTSPAAFLNCVKSNPRESWAFFETILGDQPQKPYFDIDMPVDGVDRPDEFGRALVDNLVQRAVAALASRDYCVDIEQDVLVFSSHAAHKRSYHVVFDRVAFQDYRENHRFGTTVIDQMPTEYAKYVDRGMWSRTQQFRLYLSQKPHSGRPKVFNRTWTYHGETISSAVGEDMDDAFLMTTVFTASCVSWTSTCRILESTESTASPLSPTYTSPELPRDVYKAVVSRSPDKVWRVFEISAINGSLVSLKRLTPSKCSLCRRVHDHENAFLVIKENGDVYFHCHGTRRHVKDAPTSFLLCDVSDVVVQNMVNERDKRPPVRRVVVPDVRLSMQERLRDADI